MIFITGDTHGAIGKDADKLLDEKLNKLNRTDYVIVAGDFGFILNDSEKLLLWLKTLSNKPYTLLFVDGNHENFDKLYSYPVEEWHGGKIHRIAENIIHLMRGQVFNIDNKKIFTFGGATSIDIETRSEFIDWWSQELPTTAELNDGIDNLEKNNWEVDYIISHCCDSNTLKTVSAFGGFKHDYDLDILNKYFDFLEENLKYKHWYFGHYHLDIKHVDKKKTVVYQNIINIEDDEVELLIINKKNVVF